MTMSPSSLSPAAAASCAEWSAVALADVVVVVVRVLRWCCGGIDEWLWEGAGGGAEGAEAAAAETLTVGAAAAAAEEEAVVEVTFISCLRRCG